MRLIIAPMVVKHTSLIPKESIDTHSEPLQRIDTMENINFGVEELVGLLRGQDFTGFFPQLLSTSPVYAVFLDIR
jgi:hypothetical protein